MKVLRTSRQRQKALAESAAFEDASSSGEPHPRYKVIQRRAKLASTPVMCAGAGTHLRPMVRHLVEEQRYLTVVWGVHELRNICESAFDDTQTDGTQVSRGVCRSSIVTVSWIRMGHIRIRSW